MRGIKKRWVLVAAVILCMLGKGYAATPLYTNSLQSGLENLEQNNQEAEMLLSFDSAPQTEDSWIIFSFSASGCLLSACTASGCLLSGCVGSGCLGSVCVGSGCVVSGCAGSVCLGSLCGTTMCVGSGCAGSVCVGSVCGTSACFGSVCVGSGCIGSVCVGSACVGSVCVGTACSSSVCAGSGCDLSLCDTTGCSTSACSASGECDAKGLQVDPGYLLASAQLTNGRLSICANFSGRYDIVYVDSAAALKTVTLDLDAGIVSNAELSNAKELRQVVKAV
jgi:uncharacterized protein YjbI with pentapeptide repeats